MRNLENLAFRFGQNFQKISVLVRMASGVAKSARFVWMGTSGLKLSKFVRIMTTFLKKLLNLFRCPPGHFQMFTRRPKSRDQAQ